MTQKTQRVSQLKKLRKNKKNMFFSGQFDPHHISPPKRDPKGKKNFKKTAFFRNKRVIFSQATCPYHPWDWYIYLHEWLIFMVNVGKYTIHGWYGLIIPSFQRSCQPNDLSSASKVL